MITITRVISISALRRRSFILRLLTNDDVAWRHVILVAISALRLSELSIRVMVPSDRSRLVLLDEDLLSFRLSRTRSNERNLRNSTLNVLRFSCRYVAVEDFYAPRLRLINDVRHDLRGGLSLKVRFSCREDEDYGTFRRIVIIKVGAINVR